MHSESFPSNRIFRFRNDIIWGVRSSESNIFYEQEDIQILGNFF